MGYQHEDEEEVGARQGRVLWGRLGLLALGLAVMFVLGRWTADGGADEGELEALAAERDALQQQLAETEAELDAVEAGGVDEPDPDDAAEEAEQADATAEADGAEEPGDGEDPADEGDASTRRHEVQASETLYTIAEQYYDDGERFNLITEANNLARDEPLRVGQVLEIPPEN